MSTLQVIWYMLIGVLLTGYAVLDGFDLGVGFWTLFTKKGRDRRILLNAIGPVWDGNEVWLITGAGALFAAFPPVYAAVFSGLYIPLMLVLLGLIFRAVSIEFRGKTPSSLWQKTWDTAFGAGSVLAALLFGVAIGNILRGLSLDAAGNYAGTLTGLLHPYALLIGLVGLAMTATHGALYLVLKTEGDLGLRARRWARKAWVVYLALFVLAGIATFAYQRQLLTNYRAQPVLWILPLFALAAIACIGLFNRSGRPLHAFVCSALSIAGLMSMVGASIFPALVPARNDPSLSLTLANASSSELTLRAMLVIAIIGMPLILGYTLWIYRTFAGKVKLEEESY